MKRTVTFLFVTVLVLAAAPIFAQSASTNLSVTANVAANCSITTNPVAFGAYDPLVANATSPAGDLAGTGSIVVTCTKGSGTRIDLGLGSNAQGATRRMAGAVGGDFLTYELYKESAHTNVWGTGATNGDTIGGAPNKNSRTVTVYGNLPGAQDVTATSYSDTVQATIIF